MKEHMQKEIDEQNRRQAEKNRLKEEELEREKVEAYDLGSFGANQKGNVGKTKGSRRNQTVDRC